MSRLSRQRTPKNGSFNKRAGADVDIVLAPTYLAIPKDRFQEIIDELPVYMWVHDENYTIVHTNRKFLDRYGNCNGRPCHHCIMKSNNVCNCCKSSRILKNNSEEKCIGCSNAGGNKNAHTFHRPLTRKDGSKYVLKSTVLMDYLYEWLKKFEETKKDPEADIDNIFCSMCSSCKRIKDDKSNWINLENFLIHNFNIVISHGICPECINKLYPQIKKA